MCLMLAAGGGKYFAFSKPVPVHGEYVQFASNFKQD